MNMLDRANRDVRRQTFNRDGFNTELIITDRENNQYTVNGIAAVHAIEADIDDGGDYVAVGDSSYITFSEPDLTDQGAVVRRGNDLDMTDWRVEFIMHGRTYRALIAEPYPDHTFAVINASITDYE